MVSFISHPPRTPPPFTLPSPSYHPMALQVCARRSFYFGSSSPEGGAQTGLGAQIAASNQHLLSTAGIAVGRPASSMEYNADSSSAGSSVASSRQNSWRPGGELLLADAANIGFAVRGAGAGSGSAAAGEVAVGPADHDQIGSMVSGRVSAIIATLNRLNQQASVGVGGRGDFDPPFFFARRVDQLCATR